MRPQPTSAYDQLLEQLEKLPGIGRRSAERIAFALLRRPADDSLALAAALRAFRENLTVCTICGHVTESDPCAICTDPKRDASTVLVVEQPSDVFAIEQAGSYNGHYHVLMGRLAPLEAIGPGDLNIAGLLERILDGTVSGRVDIKEVILATNPTSEGDYTAAYLLQRLKPLDVRVTRLGRGLSVGGDLEYADAVTLTRALESRQEL